jgi:hypothetical protein
VLFLQKLLPALQQIQEVTSPAGGHR